MKVTATEMPLRISLEQSSAAFLRRNCPVTRQSGNKKTALMRRGLDGGGK